MIRKFTIFSFSALFLFIACKKSNNDSKPPTDPAVPDSVSIIGKWRPVSGMAYYYDPSTNVFVDSGRLVAGPTDYYDFEKGVIYYYFKDGTNDIYDTIPFHFAGQYVVAPDQNTASGYDSLKMKFLTKDSLMLTAIKDVFDYSTSQIENEHDTTVLIRLK
jgi:hypothetical protein